jgi:hypothetical protein
LAIVAPLAELELSPQVRTAIALAFLSRSEPALRTTVEGPLLQQLVSMLRARLAAADDGEVVAALGRIVALYHHSSTS